MTVPTSYAPDLFTTPGATVLACDSVYVLDSTHVVVISRDDTTGVETLLADPAGYSVSGTFPGQPTVTLTSGIPASTTVWVKRLTPLTQDHFDLSAGGTIPAGAIESAVDRLHMIAEELQEQVSRSLRHPAAEGAMALLDPRPSRASDNLEFDASGDIDVVAP